MAISRGNTVALAGDLLHSGSSDALFRANPRPLAR